MYKLYNKDCLKILNTLNENTIDALVTDPPYGISYKDHEWDKSIPKKIIWEKVLDILKPGAFGLVFSSVRFMHRVMVHLEDSGFKIKDVIFWAYLNGMPKSRNIGLAIDKEQGIKSKNIGSYKYVQGYKKNQPENYKSNEQKTIYSPRGELGIKYDGAGLGIKPIYEPVILIQKPIEKNLTVAKNIIKHGVGSLNLEETRILYERGEKKVGHNPHPKGRVMGNILRTDKFNDGYDKFFLVPKVRSNKDNYNNHPTIKPLNLMEQLVKLVSFKNHIILDPFMGSGSTGVAALNNSRDFVGCEIDESYFQIAEKRIKGNY